MSNEIGRAEFDKWVATFSDPMSDAYQDTGMDEAFLAGFQRGKESSEACLEKLIEACEDWCGINAFDADKGACDEHNCDDDRGMNCSANELLDYIKELITTLRKDRK